MREQAKRSCGCTVREHARLEAATVLWAQRATGPLETHEADDAEDGADEPQRRGVVRLQEYGQVRPECEERRNDRCSDGSLVHHSKACLRGNGRSAPIIAGVQLAAALHGATGNENEPRRRDQPVDHGVRCRNTIAVAPI